MIQSDTPQTLTIPGGVNDNADIDVVPRVFDDTWLLRQDGQEIIITRRQLVTLINAMTAMCVQSSAAREYIRIVTGNKGEEAPR